MLDLKRECYFIAVADGATVERNRVTICSIPSLGNITRYQVYTNQRGQDFCKMYKEIDAAVDKFMELSS